MAGIVDIIYLTATLLILGGAVAAILFVVNSISAFTSTTKEKLKSKGYDVSRKGVAVQTQKRFNREDYVDATQRGLVKAFGASSYGKASSDGSGPSSDKLQVSCIIHDPRCRNLVLSFL
ncbi:hypothetical protein JB92DRAFT_2256286 [Gautieria morchelliformis]|nr:hypothetical protein JB92DRAFT_2256286 [Gautieria morchelliformis]